MSAIESVINDFISILTHSNNLPILNSEMFLEHTWTGKCRFADTNDR